MRENGFEGGKEIDEENKAARGRMGGTKDVFQKLVEKGTFQNPRQVSLISRYVSLSLGWSRRLSTVFECVEVLAVYMEIDGTHGF